MQSHKLVKKWGIKWGTECGFSIPESSSTAFELLMASLWHLVLTNHLSIMRQLLKETPPPTEAEEDKKKYCKL